MATKEAKMSKAMLKDGKVVTKGNMVGKAVTKVETNVVVKNGKPDAKKVVKNGEVDVNVVVKNGKADVKVVVKDGKPETKVEAKVEV